MMLQTCCAEHDDRQAGQQPEKTALLLQGLTSSTAAEKHLLTKSEISCSQILAPRLPVCLLIMVSIVSMWEVFAVKAALR